MSQVPESMNSQEKLEEGYSTQRPPMFNGKFYSYWKNRMEIFIKAENYQVWRVIEVGDFEVTKTNAENEVVPKPMSEFSKEDFDKYEMNAMAVKILHCGLGPHEHNRVMGCKNAKQIWELLQVTHEGTNEVKRSKIDLLMSKYERFEMLPKETIQEMFTRFTNITNELVSLGRIIPTDEQVRKILRSMPQDDRWRTKVTALFETKDFTKFNIEQLAGSLMTHELHLGAAVPESSRSRGLALKAEELDESEPDEEEAAMLVRRMRKLYRNFKPGNQKGRNFAKKITSSKTEQGCFKCGETDHQIRECPLWENDKTRGKGKEQVKDRFNKSTFNRPNFKKAMIAAWGEATDSEDDEEQPNEETANLCLMARTEGTDQVPSEEVSSSTLQCLSKSKLIELLLETLDDYKKLSILKAQSDRALELSKDHINYLNNIRSDVQGRFFELLDRNTSINESFEKIRNENILLQVQLSQYKMFNLSLDPTKSLEINMGVFNIDLENLNKDLITTKEQKEKLERELSMARAQRQPPKVPPKWIENAQSKRTEGLGFNHKNSHKKKYVDLPSVKVCFSCGSGSHISTECSKMKEQDQRNINYVKQKWVKKSEVIVEKELEETRVPVTNL